MRAARYDRYGGPDVLHVVEIEEPRPAPGEVLVQLEAAGLNPADYKVRRGATPLAPLPSGIGREFAGHVLAADADSGFRVGDAVIGTGEWVIQERIALAPELLAHRPGELDPRLAACLPVAVQTAAVEVRSQHLGPGDTVLVSGAGGGVGLPAAQLAARTGARVLGTVGPRHDDLLRSLGIEPVRYGEGLAERLRAVAPEGLTAVLDHYGPEIIETALALGVPRDRINTVSGYAERYAVAGVGRRGMDRALVEDLAAQVADGRLLLRLDSEFPLARIVDAYTHLETGRPDGRVVLVF